MLPITNNKNINSHLSILNYLINTFNFKSYLEIGVYTGNNFVNINCENKESCDITNQYLKENIDITYLMSSDDMFAQMDVDKKYDLIFIDGMHSEQNVDRDIINSLKHLNHGGFVCLHDTVVYRESAQVEYDKYSDRYGEWNGSTWKSITKLQYQNLEFYTIDNGDYGLTVIFYCPFYDQLYIPEYKSPVNYNYVFVNQDNQEIVFDSFTLQGRYIMHVIDVNDFVEICKNIKK